MSDQEYDDMRDADVALAHFINDELTEAWVPVFNAMCKPDFPVTTESLAEYKAFKVEIDAGTVMMEDERVVDAVEEKYIRVATLPDVIAVLKLNRRYTVAIIKDLLLNKRCPADLTLYNPPRAEVDDE